jgi:hypothetical protein
LTKERAFQKETMENLSADLEILPIWRKIKIAKLLQMALKLIFLVKFKMADLQFQPNFTSMDLHTRKKSGIPTVDVDFGK